MTLYKWSTTAANNDVIDSTINWQEGQSAGSVNGSSRAMMAAIAKWRDDMSGNLVTGGTSTAYTLTTNQVYTALTDGITVTCRMSATSGAAPTLNVDSLGAIPIAKVYGTAIDIGILLSGGIYTFTYDSTDNKWIVGNAERFFTATDITSSATGDVAATTVQGAIAELASEKVATTRTLTAAGLVTGGGTLAADRTFTVTAATQANQEAATDTTTVVVTPGRQHFHPGHPKSWVLFVGSGTAAITTSYAMSSLADNGTGLWTFTLSTAFSSANFAWFISTRASNDALSGVLYGGARGTGTKTSSTLQVSTSSASVLGSDTDEASVLFLGDQ